ncbi:MAG: hydrogen peroxide-inducible genes activator [Chromatiales bacterium]|jgi:LysR family hydrogen peroxide-inducible transcriptional activator
MTLSELRYIVALAREQHFGRAAEACFVSQPTLSVAVKKLEEELGVTLFERGKGEVTLTPIGELVVGQAQRALEEASAVKRIAQAHKDPLDGPLRLGLIYTIGPYLLPDLIPTLNERAPRMPLLIEESYTAELSRRLRQGDLDAIVISLPFEERGVLTRALYDEPFVVVVPAAHPWALREEIAADELAGEPLLMLGAGHCFRDQVLNACPSCNRAALNESEIQRTIEGGSLETIRHMVASGMGVTVLPCTAAGADRYQQRLLAVRRFSNPTPSRRVALAWRSSYPRPEAIEALHQAVSRCRLSCVTPADDS